MVKTFLNHQIVKILEKTIRKANYFSEIYQVEPVYVRNQPTNLLRKSIA